MKQFVQVAALGLAAMLKTCSGNQPPPADHPKQYIIVLDASASRTPDTLQKDKDFVKRVVGQTSFGDRISFMQMQQNGLTDHTEPWSTVIPFRQDTTFETQRDTDALNSKRNGLARSIPNYFKTATAGKVMHTDIFATLHEVAEVEQAASGRPKIVILISDMYQSAKGIEMEHASAMPPASYIEAQKKIGALPALSGACVLVVGASSSNRQEIEVREFWKKYFKAAGADLRDDNYVFLTPPPDRELCS